MASSKIDLNKCTPSELCTATPGLSGALASRIIASRRRRQRFKNVDEVLQVRGITDDVYNTLCQHVKVVNSKTTKTAKANKTARRNVSSPRQVLVIEPDTEIWTTPGKSKKTRIKRKDTPARPKSTVRNVRGKRKDTPGRKVTQASRPKVSRQSTRVSSTTKLPRPSTTSKQTAGRTSRFRTLKQSKQSETGRKSSSARKNVTHKPPAGKKVADMKSRSKSPSRSINAPKAKAKSPPRSRSPVRFNKRSKSPSRSPQRSRSPVRFNKRSSSPISNRGKSTVVGGSSGERTTAHLKNCFVAVHSTPKGNLAPIVTVDINPTQVENGRLSCERSRSPVRRAEDKRPARERSRSPVRRNTPRRARSPIPGQRATSPLRLSPIRSPTELAFLNSQDISNTKENPLSVSESLDELLANSRNKSHGKDNRSEGSERVSQWLEESSKYNLTNSPMNNTTRSAKYALDQSYNSQFDDTCKRSLEMDFDEVSPVRSSLRKRGRFQEDACSCGVCNRCGKMKTPRRRHRAGSTQSLVLPSLPNWCNLL